MQTAESAGNTHKPKRDWFGVRGEGPFLFRLVKACCNVSKRNLNQHLIPSNGMPLNADLQHLRLSRCSIFQVKYNVLIGKYMA